METFKSRQLEGRTIKGTLFATSTSALRQNDYRTWVSYYKAEDGLIHSGASGYSIIYLKPVTEAEFMLLIEDSLDHTIVTIK